MRGDGRHGPDRISRRRGVRGSKAADTQTTEASGNGPDNHPIGDQAEADHNQPNEVGVASLAEINGKASPPTSATGHGVGFARLQNYRQPKVSHASIWHKSGPANSLALPRALPPDLLQPLQVLAPED
jgi:hypothetical protein